MKIKNKKNGILKELSVIPTGSTVAIQYQGGGPWTHGTMVKGQTIISIGNEE